MYGGLQIAENISIDGFSGSSDSEKSPYPALVKLPDYPKVCLSNIEGFDGFVKEMDHNQRVAFWRAVMSYAHARGMYFFFGNLIVE